MAKKSTIHITIILAIVGFMLAVQFNTTQSPENELNSDVWEIRQQLAEEKKLHSEYLIAIREASNKIMLYEDEEQQSHEKILNQTLQSLREQIGSAEVSGPGIEIVIKPSEEAKVLGLPIGEIPPSLLIRLVNDIYRYSGLYIEIDGKRLTYASAIRDINGKTTVNSEPIDYTHTVIKIVGNTTEDMEKLYNHLQASPFPDEFFIDNFSFDVKEPSAVTLNRVELQLETQYLQEVKGD